MTTWVRRLRRRISRRGYALLFFALLGVVFGLSLTAGDLPATSVTNFYVHLMPLAAWGWLWFITGAVCLVYAFIRRDRVAFGLVMGVTTLWGLMALGATFYGYPRGWVSSAIWLGFASWVFIISGWPDPPRDAGELVFHPESQIWAAERHKQAKDARLWTAADHGETESRLWTAADRGKTEDEERAEDTQVQANDRQAERDNERRSP